MRVMLRFLPSVFFTVVVMAIANTMSAAPVPVTPASDSATPNAIISENARRLYDTAKPHLLQIRIVLKDRGNQTSVGSGFVVAGGLIVTNYHVIAQYALSPEKYRAVYSGTNGSSGNLNLLAIDVRRDLAVLAFDGTPLMSGALAWADTSPHQGDRLYSLGNPLDIGFAVVEGTYNGVPPRAFYPQMLFTGALNPGMSGGPVLNTAGRVVGINVAKHTDGELVSFLVPAHFARQLTNSADRRRLLTLPAHAEVTRQLLAHQQSLVARTLAKPLRQQTHGHWKVPLLSETWARCWGAAAVVKPGELGVEHSICTMDTALFSGLGETGTLSLRHKVYDGSRLGAWRFARQYSNSLTNEGYSATSTKLTAVRCQEGYVEAHKLPLRGILCVRAHRKFPGLYDFSVLAMTLDSADRGVLGRLDATGMSYPSGIALARHFLGGYRWAL